MRALVSRLAKELAFAVVASLIADYALGSFFDWMRDRPKEHVEDEPIERTEVAAAVAPPEPPVITIEEQMPPSTSPRHLDGSTVYTHACQTPGGERATFEIVVFSESYNWKIESDECLEVNGREKTEEEFLAILSSQGYRQIMGNAQEIVVAGTASCEGDERGEEEARALRRALKLREWIERSNVWQGRLRPPRSIHTLNLGQYHADCAAPPTCDGFEPDETRSQRKVILMAILERDADLDRDEIGWCIQESVRRDDQLDFLMRHYCRYDLNTDLNGHPT